MRTLKLRWSAAHPRPHSRAGIESLKGLSSRAVGFSAALWGTWPSLGATHWPHGQRTEASQGSTGGRRAGSGEVREGEGRAQRRRPWDGVPREARAPGQRRVGDAPTRAPTLPREGRVPRPPCSGPSLGAEWHGDGRCVLYPRCSPSLALGHPTQHTAEAPLVPEDELSTLTLTADKK